MDRPKIFKKIKQQILSCKYLLVGAGAGMGRDSGLPDFRGNEGFWNSYPPYRNKFDFYSCANPSFLQSNPNLFWGFYGSRLVMYRQKQPHKGFNIIKEISMKMKDHFIITSNVDGHFHRVFEENKIYEVHGSIHYLQCSKCLQLVENNFEPQIDYQQMLCKKIPKCLKCNNFLRPNILMFQDWDWITDRSQIQRSKFSKFVKNAISSGQTIGIIQIGCGSAIPTIRNLCENIYFNNKNSVMVRINPDEEQTIWSNKQRFYHIKMGALDALSELTLN